MTPKLFRPFCLLVVAGLSLAACNDDSTQAQRKGEVDVDALQSGVQVSLSAPHGTVIVPFTVAVPVDSSDPTGGDADDFQDEMSDAVSLVVVGDQSGATANLVSGTIVDGAPSGPGQWRWEFNDTRDEATLTFFNQTPTGLTLKSSRTYSATLAVTNNAWIETVPSFTFSISVVGN